MTPLITAEQRVLLLANGAEFKRDQAFDPVPVVSLFSPDSDAAWLLASLDPDDPDIAFGLCAVGPGRGQLGTVRISDIERVRGRYDLPVERDAHFAGYSPLSTYTGSAA